MQFSKGEYLKQVQEAGNSVRTRWQVEDVEYKGRIVRLLLRDESNAVEPPMQRKAVGTCINYFDRERPIDHFTIMEWRNQFRTACECAAGNFAGLAEPFDYFTVPTKDSKGVIPTDLRDNEPMFIYSYGEIKPVKPLHPKAIEQNETRLFKRLYSLLCDVGYTMKALHEKKIVLRQARLENLRWLVTARSHFMAEFFSLAWMNKPDYDPHRTHLVLDPRFSAPECFDLDTERYTPATDVYVLAKLCLQYMGVFPDKHTPTETDLYGYLQNIETKFKVRLREEAKTTLKIALQPDPDNRFQNTGEFLGRIKGYEKKKGPSGPKKVEDKQKEKNKKGGHSKKGPKGRSTF